MNCMFLTRIDCGEFSVKENNSPLNHLMSEAASQTIHGSLQIFNTQPLFIITKHIKLYRSSNR